MKKINENYFINPNQNLNATSIDHILEKDEKILWRGKPLRKSFILNSFLKFLPFGLIWLCFDAGFIAFMVISVPEMPHFMIAFLCVFFAFHLIPVWIWVFSTISASKRQKIEEYAFTDKRILVKKGFIGSNIISLYYSSLTSVNLKIGIVEKMCKVGDIYIVANDQKVVLEDILDPSFICGKLQQIAHDIKTDVYFPNALRPKENQGYQTEYKGVSIDTKSNNNK